MRWAALRQANWPDFAVLEADPLEVDPVTLKDIEVWGTVLGGVLHPAGSAT